MTFPDFKTDSVPSRVINRFAWETMKISVEPSLGSCTEQSMPLEQPQTGRRKSSGFGRLKLRSSLEQNPL
eukprot:2449100-Karenia_brevis.AAC.1